MIDKERKFLVGVSFTLLALFLSVSSAFLAQTPEPVKNHEIIFLLDASNSMNTTDPDGLTLDSVEEMVSALPSNYSMGFVAYDSEVQAAVNLGPDRNALKEAIRRVQYTGYTNAGAGIEEALQLFSKGVTASKAIVLFSDGEIMMDSEEKTAASSDRFKRIKQEAENRGIPIYTVAIGERVNAPASNIYGEGNSQGKIYEANTVLQVPEIVKKIMYEDLGVQKNSVSTGEVKNSRLSIKIPIEHIAYIDRAKILITSDRPMENVSAAYNAENGEINIGKRYALIDIVHPKIGEAEIQLGSSMHNNIRADLLMEMKSVIKAETAAPLTRQGENEKITEVRLTPIGVADENLRLLDDPYFENKPIRVTADGEILTAKVSKGTICFTLPATNTREVAIKIHFEDIGINMIAPETIFVQVDKAEGNGIYLAFISVAAVVICILIWYRKRRNGPRISPPPSGQYEFAGKLSLYITQTPDDSDVEPQIYNLHRRFTQDEISLGAILTQCGIHLSFEGADQIYVSPGANKELALTNKSDCTILKNRELLIKDHSCIIGFDEKIYITFEDERSEMVLHYKSVKPNDNEK